MSSPSKTEPRTANATRAAQLAAQRKRASYLIGRGWICIPPDADLESEFPTIQPWALRGMLSLVYGTSERGE